MDGCTRRRTRSQSLGAIDAPPENSSENDEIADELLRMIRVVEVMKIKQLQAVTRDKYDALVEAQRISENLKQELLDLRQEQRHDNEKTASLIRQITCRKKKIKELQNELRDVRAESEAEVERVMQKASSAQVEKDTQLFDKGRQLQMMTEQRDAALMEVEKAKRAIRRLCELTGIDFAEVMG
jgi:chromosome segregation ATPase